MSPEENKQHPESVEHVHFMCAVMFYLLNPKKWRRFFNSLDMDTLTAYEERLGTLSEDLEYAVRTMQNDQEIFRQMALAISGFYEMDDAILEIIEARKSELNRVLNDSEDKDDA